MPFINLKTIGSGKTASQRYLQSETWVARKKSVLDRQPICQVCNWREATEVEHKRHGNDKRNVNEDISELIAVCECCREQLPGLRQADQEWRKQKEQKQGE